MKNIKCVTLFNDLIQTLTKGSFIFQVVKWLRQTYESFSIKSVGVNFYETGPIR